MKVGLRVHFYNSVLLLASLFTNLSKDNEKLFYDNTKKISNLGVKRLSKTQAKLNQLLQKNISEFVLREVLMHIER